MPLGAHKAAIMGVAGVSTGDVVLLSSQTADDDASISFTSDITSTYGEYIFRFYNINPATDQAYFGFSPSTDGGSNYNALNITSTAFRAYHEEDGTDSALSYSTSNDKAEATTDQVITWPIGNGADESANGTLWLFNPSNTTYVKHFYSRFSTYGSGGTIYPDYAHDNFVAGYINSTSDVDAVQFSMSSGNFDGTIKMWGVK